jgi:hypothetical protein
MHGSRRASLQRQPETGLVFLLLLECMRQTLLVVANYSDKNATYELPAELKDRKWKRLLTNYNNAPSVDDARELLPYEVEVYEVVE